MPISTLEDMTAALDRACADMLGEEIQYAANGTTFAPVQADVDYRDAVKPFEGAAAAEQDIMVSVLKVDVAAKPTTSARLTLARRPGKTFQPRSTRTDASGTGWEFELKEVPGA